MRGVVLTSTIPKIFCGGIRPEDARARDGRGVRAVRARLRLAVLRSLPPRQAARRRADGPRDRRAARSSPATADFRFAAEGPGTIGLPEVTLGIHVPRHCLEAMRTTVGEQALTRWALLGETMPFAEAHELGAIDRIVPADRLLEEAVSFAQHLGGASSEVYAAIKRDLRGAAYERALDVQPDARKAFVDSWFSETGQRGLDRALARS